jgi:nucleoside-diphosphate-sugar epimerase
MHDDIIYPPDNQDPENQACERYLAVYVRYPYDRHFLVAGLRDLPGTISYYTGEQRIVHPVPFHTASQGHIRAEDRAMKILLTGATGFIGRNLVKHLLVKGHELVCLVRRTSNADFLEKAGVPLAVGDITDADAVDSCFREVRPQAVFHCAASVREKNEAKLYKVNVEATRNICRACQRHDTDRLVYLSSVAVISGNPQVPLVDDLPYKATSAYGRSKAEAERVVLDFRREGLPVSVIRPCMIYGEDEPHALDRLLRAAESRRIPILDVPEMDSRLHLAYVGNVVQALILALEKDEAVQGTFMVADKEVITARKFLEILYDGLERGYPPVVPGWAVKLLMVIPPLRRKIKRIFKDRVYDITRAVNLLGYDPETSTEEGLRRTVRHWKNERRERFTAAA